MHHKCTYGLSDLICIEYNEVLLWSVSTFEGACSEIFGNKFSLNLPISSKVKNCKFVYLLKGIRENNVNVIVYSNGGNHIF